MSALLFDVPSIYISSSSLSVSVIVSIVVASVKCVNDFPPFSLPFVGFNTVCFLELLQSLTIVEFCFDIGWIE
jgi:hypothetical protein